jgi:hypothetical protein
MMKHIKYTPAICTYDLQITLDELTLHVEGVLILVLGGR